MVFRLSENRPAMKTGAHRAHTPCLTVGVDMYSHVMSLHTLSIHELLILACVLACTGCNWNGEVGAIMICVLGVLQYCW